MITVAAITEAARAGVGVPVADVNVLVAYFVHDDTLCAAVAVAGDIDVVFGHGQPPGLKMAIHRRRFEVEVQAVVVPVVEAVVEEV